MIGGGVAEGGAMHRVMEAYRDANARRGRNLALGENLSIGFHFYIADTQEEAIEAAAGYYEENLEDVRPAAPGSRPERRADRRDVRPVPRPDLRSASHRGRRKRGRILAGPPELIIEQLKKLEEAYPGLDRVGVSHPVGTPESVIVEQLEQFAEDVMPAFSGAEVEAAAGN